MALGTTITTFPPQAYIIGAQKAATTSLAVLLNQHPAITLCNPKEPGFFTNNWDKGLGWYRSCFNRLDTLLLDASTSYTMAETGFSGQRATDARAVDVPERIYRLRPDARFIYIVRDPAARVFSAYWHEVRERRETRPLRQFITEDPAFLDPSFYFIQISRYLRYFDLDRFLLVIFEEFVRDPLAHADRCTEFLGAAPYAFASEASRNESFRYNWLGRATREILGLQRLKGAATMLKSAFPDRMYRSLKSVVTRPVPQLGEDDRTWLAAFFRDDYAAFLDLMQRQKVESPNGRRSSGKARLPGADRSDPSTTGFADPAGQAAEP